MDEKGQGSMEMLLLVAGGIIVVTIVALILKGTATDEIQPMSNEALHKAIG